MTSYNSAKFGGHRHCGSGDTFLVVEKQNFKFFATRNTKHLLKKTR